VQSPVRAHWELTDTGRDLLARHPTALPESVLREIQRKGKRTTAADHDETSQQSERVASDRDDAVNETDDATPDERFRDAYGEIRGSVREELLTQVRSVSATFFERLVLDLLHAMGYGTRRADLTTTQAGADGGIDGVITLDRLGLEKVYVQAKRYAEDNSVGRPTIQAFLGALAGRRANKGVFITTSRFSKEARDFAQSASDGLVLIDGRQLAEMMIDHNVGVSTRETFTLVAIDNDYFEDA